MTARLTDQYLEGLSQQGQLMVQMIAISANSMADNARRVLVAGGKSDGKGLDTVVQQLILQRRLAAEVLENELGQSEFDIEIAMLQTVLEDLCRTAERAALGAQAELALRAGNSALADRINNYLENGVGLAEAA